MEKAKQKKKMRVRWIQNFRRLCHEDVAYSRENIALINWRRKSDSFLRLRYIFLSYKSSHPHQKIKRKHDFLLKVIIDEKLSVEGREAQFSINRLKNK